LVVTRPKHPFKGVPIFHTKTGAQTLWAPPIFSFGFALQRGPLGPTHVVPVSGGSQFFVGWAKTPHLRIAPPFFQPIWGSTIWQIHWGAFGCALELQGLLKFPHNVFPQGVRPPLGISNAGFLTNNILSFIFRRGHRAFFWGHFWGVHL